ncbi:MAG: hypothetical protein C6W55_10355 [Thermobacillus sp.]|jgi:hypothetical protein|uniref:hypothetical protein n=1 Tax=Thermobacillus sp. TaxID=2108467 RepID=UPI000E3921F3|nr:hypothetical protein [Thermobacillus sp.]REK54725.1 MAG: hypothetical protein C6W55_10355 [Thermobacillus sp.]
MSGIMELLQSYEEVIDVYEFVGEWEVWIGYQKVRIKVLKDKNGGYVSSTSHYYHGSQQAGPYISSINGGKTVEAAVREAMRQLLTFYRPDDENAKWVVNDSY